MKKKRISPQVKYLEEKVYYLERMLLGLIVILAIAFTLLFK